MARNQHRSLALLMLYFAFLGIWLSGYLSYQTLFAPTGCGRALITCGIDPVRFFGVPQCVLGFAMFMAVAAVAIGLLRTERPRPWLQTQRWLSTVGTLFAAGLSAYELWWKDPAPTVLPACVLGFFLYLGIWLSAMLSRPPASITPLSTQ